MKRIIASLLFITSLTLHDVHASQSNLCEKACTYSTIGFGTGCCIAIVLKASSVPLPYVIPCGTIASGCCAIAIASTCPRSNVPQRRYGR